MEVYETVAKIAAVMHRNPSTIYRWVRKHGFPCAKLPNGNVFTTDQLINQWCLSRQIVSRRRDNPPDKQHSKGIVGDG